MKKVCTSMLFALLAVVMLLVGAQKTNAAGLDYIEENQLWFGSWTADTKYKYAYLTVDQTGYYDLVAEDLVGSANLSLWIHDLDSTYDEINCYDTDTYASRNNDVYTVDNMFLIAGHLYEIRMEYSYTDTSDYSWVNMSAEVNITVSYAEYENIVLENGVYANLTAASGTTDWLEFTTWTEGDYIFNLNQETDFSVAVYEKLSGERVRAVYFDNVAYARLHLEANSEYVNISVVWSVKVSL